MVGAVDETQVTYQLANLHGDIVANQADAPGPLTIDTFNETDEFGNGADESTARYGWLGQHQRSTDADGGMTLMGARVYNPATGVFLSPDPVLEGNVTRFTYPQDPMNSADLTGKKAHFYWWGGYKKYTVRFAPDYFRIWLAGWVLGAIIKRAEGVGHFAVAGKYLTDLRLSFSGVAGISLNPWVVGVAAIAGLSWMAVKAMYKRGYSLAFRVWSWLPGSPGYIYFSRFAYGLGR